MKAKGTIQRTLKSDLSVDGTEALRTVAHQKEEGVVSKE